MLDNNKPPTENPTGHFNYAQKLTKAGDHA